jgi:PAS domain S-box-containing protein
MGEFRPARLGATAALLLSMAGVAALCVYSTRQVLSERADQNWIYQSQSVMHALVEYRDALKIEKSSRRDYLATRAADDASRHERALGMMIEKSADLVFLATDDPDEKSLAQSLDAATRALRITIARLFAASGKEKTASATLREADALTTRARSYSRDMEVAALRQLAGRLADARSLSQNMVSALTGAAALGFLGIGSGLWLFKREVSARDDVHEVLSSTRARYEAMLEHSPAVVLLKNSADRILYVNRSAERALGVPREQALRNPYLHQLAPNIAAIIRRNDEQVLASGVPMEFEETDGSKTYLTVKFPLQGPTGDTELCVMATDITAVKEQELRLAKVNKELESFAYSVSHDLRAPLRAIDGFAKILSEDYGPKLDEEGRRVIGRIRHNAERMARLIDDLLSFSRLGRQELRRTEVDMTTLARKAVEESASLEPGRNVRLELAQLPHALGDAPMLTQVWINLVANAYKYTRRNPDARVEIGGAVADGEDVYWVKDNGVGFDPRHSAKLFEVFSRLHGADEFEGTGVGLALVRRVVERHGGRVFASSAVGAGAEFRFTLPHGEQA